MKKMIKEHPVLSSILISFILGGVFSFLPILFSSFMTGTLDISNASDFFVPLFILWIIWGAFLIYPFVLTIINVGFMIVMATGGKMIRGEKWFEYITIVLGILYSGLYMMLSDTVFNADWTETLYNSQLHTPIWTEGYPTVIAVAFVGIIGYLVLSWIPLKKMPPLVLVSAMAAMYLGAGECILWIVQMQGATMDALFLSLFPLNCIFITIKTVGRKVKEWNEMEEHTDNYYENNSFLKALNGKLGKAETWPFAALILMLPLLGIMICILVLFGQRPDAIIKAWTETADWGLSQKVAPQNVMYDEHYLCTVAAGGHRKVVKPIRMGVRHGHRVTVNRQLCIANAFEQILEERTPRFHRHVRHFYDTYGFPVARLIRSRYVADVVYFLMKPLEWIFLIVIYFCDVKPENRIAMQYMPKPE